MLYSVCYILQYAAHMTNSVTDIQFCDHVAHWYNSGNKQTTQLLCWLTDHNKNGNMGRASTHMQLTPNQKATLPPISGRLAINYNCTFACQAPTIYNSLSKAISVTVFHLPEKSNYENYISKCKYQKCSALCSGMKE